jgi:SsrA-binding protein
LPPVADPKQGGEKLIARNKRASFDYELGERYEAGLALQGSEVKMLRLGKVDLSDAWCAVEQQEAYLKGMSIPVVPWLAFAHEPKRPRKLLMHKREIIELKRAIEREGMTVVVTRLYFKEGRVKVEIAVAKGKKKGDKRESVKAKDAEREARQAMARGRRGG